MLQCLEEEARSEHRRWTAFMRLESHGPATPGRNDPNIWREANKELDAGVKVRDLARLNRNLVDYDHLDDETKAGNLLIVAAFDWIKKGAEDHFSQLL